MRKGSHHSPESRKKISEKQEGQKREPLSQETKDKIRAKHLGKTLSPEHIAKLSEKKKEFYSTEEGRKVASQNAKKHFALLTEEEKAEFLKPWMEAGRKASAETPRTDEQNKKNSEAKKKWFASLSEEEKMELLAPWIEAGMNARGSISKKEKRLEEFFRSKGLEFETQYRIGRKIVDFYIPSKNLVIEFNGCFWHQCESCGHNDGNRAGTSEEIRERDSKRIEFLQSQGYKVVVIWEHDLEKIINQQDAESA